jgi:hypothetical protein
MHEGCIQDGCIVVFDEMPSGAWIDPVFVSRITGIMNKACAENSNDVKGILLSIELEKLIHDSK